MAGETRPSSQSYGSHLAATAIQDSEHQRRIAQGAWFVGSGRTGAATSDREADEASRCLDRVSKDLRHGDVRLLRPGRSIPTTDEGLPRRCREGGHRVETAWGATNSEGQRPGLNDPRSRHIAGGPHRQKRLYQISVGEVVAPLPND